METKEALSRAAQLCSRAEKCRSEIENKLAQWDVQTTDYQTILDELQHLGFIDHARYAQAFAQEKTRINRWGVLKIRYELKNRQIEDRYINQALSAIEPDLEQIEILLKKKMPSIRAANTNEKKQKLIRFAQSRGFELETIMPIIHKLVNKSMNT